ncbi:hypothetical protein CBR_g50768 [Chara braunii]|uniref:Cupin type-1 domain-containing protein n=1 Tax=Chara braunii TaxID=69332 RepID=A0A388K5T2_CHABU|nr:hypothetical protein CBR_g50768 [Chara braunii]|eukprot:GBG65407.1 hypothetical protein CBR_g50768 [Chara braunii]
MAAGVSYKMVLAVATTCVFVVVAKAVVVQGKMSRAEGSTKTAERRLEYTEHHEVFKSEGGSVSMWADSFEQISGAGRKFSALHLTLEEDGFLLPNYSPGHGVIYVLEGSAYVGLMTPWGIPATLQRTKKGEMFVVPRGWVTWICNHHHKSETGGGQTSTFKALAVVDFPASLASEKGGKTETNGCYFLAGASERGGEGRAGHGSVLHGFSNDVLAQAWGLDEADVDKLLRSQEGVGIVKVTKTGHPELWERFVRKLSHMEVLSDMFSFVDGLAHTKRHGGRHGEEETASWFLGEFTYNVETATPAVFNEGGEMRVVGKELLPTLGRFGMGFSLAVGKLKKGALQAPGWSVNAHRIVYVTSGSGRIQIAHPNGSNALNTHVRAGSVVVIPRFYPSVKIASKDGLEFVSVTTSSLPLLVNLAGHNSLLNNMPERVVEEAFNIPSELVKKLRHQRVQYTVILPPPSSQKQQQEEKL